MSGGEVITCPLCGMRYHEGDGRACRTACPLHAGCALLRCPACGYEVPAPTRLTRVMSRWLRRRASEA